MDLNSYLGTVDFYSTPTAYCEKVNHLFAWRSVQGSIKESKMNRDWPLSQAEVEDLYNDLLTRTGLSQAVQRDGITLENAQLTENFHITAEEIEFLDNSGPSAGPGLPDPALMALPQMTLAKDMTNVQEHEDCSVCFEQMCIGEQVIQLTLCSHLFHRKCIVVWSQYQNTCPLCRGDLTIDREEGEKSC